MKNKNTLTYISYTLALGLYWACVSLTVGFAAPYLQGRGFSSGQLGALLALANLLSLLLSVWLSARTDSSGELSAISYIWLVLALQLGALLLLLGQGKAVVAFAYALLAVAVLAGNALYVKLFVNLSRLRGLEGFGISRAAGSLFYALASFAGGEILSSAPHWALLAANALCALVQIICLFHLRSVCVSALAISAPKAPQSEKRGSSADGLMPFLRRSPGFPLLLLGIALIFMVHNSNSTFMINVVEHIGGDVADMGYINGLAILTEIPIMLLYGRFGKKHCLKILKLSFGFFIVKIWLTAFAANAVTLTLGYSLRAVAFALYTPALVDYINERIPYADSGKAQGLAANIPQLGTMLGTLGFGFMFDNFAVPTILITFAAVSTLGSVIGLWSVISSKSR